MEKIRNSCTNLSRDVENKFQLYLDKVGDKVSVTCFVVFQEVCMFFSDLMLLFNMTDRLTDNLSRTILESSMEF